jgi:hypothetical protein
VVSVDAPVTIDVATEAAGAGDCDGVDGDDEPQATENPNRSATSEIRTVI